MAINYHKTTTNYSGRSVDLLLLQFVSAPGADILVKPDVSKSPRIVTGIEKMAQRYALLFLTQTGSVKNSESEGSDFLKLLGAGQIYDENTLDSAASAANNAVFRQMRLEDSTLETKDDEAIESSKVVEVEVDRNTASVSVTISLTSVAGESYVYTIPLATGV